MKFRRERGPIDPVVAEQKARDRRRHRLIAIAVAVVVLIVGYYIGAAFLPRWWSQRLADQINRHFARGIGLGLGHGFVFTFVPLAFASVALWRRLNGRVRALIILLAVVLAVPNLLTLGISTGTGSGAHAAQRTLDVDGPGFRGATLVGALVAVAIFGLVVIEVRARRGRRRPNSNAVAS
jgi:hypothetical protein